MIIAIVTGGHFLHFKCRGGRSREGGRGGGEKGLAIGDDLFLACQGSHCIKLGNRYMYIMDCISALFSYCRPRSAPPRKPIIVRSHKPDYSHVQSKVRTGRHVTWESGGSLDSGGGDTRMRRHVTCESGGSLDSGGGDVRTDMEQVYSVEP